MSYYTQGKIFSQHRGFTLLELVMIILIIGILAVVAMPNWNAESITLEYEAEHVLNDIRYAQAMSMATGQRYRWIATSSTTYQITDESGSPVVLPNGSTTMTLTGGASFGSFTGLPSSLIAFNSQGVPYITSSYPGAVLSSTAIVSVNNGSVVQNIAISPETGYGALQ